MIKNPITKKTIAVFLVVNFLSTLLPYNTLYANNNGPNAPEAAAFEPVDATDMVNLVTGNMSYVLPLLNVPSPEGGYPLALSYHSGIAMDQEASWVGLGWNLNPGAINRGVNGYPDDWKDARIGEFYYDAGGTKTYHSFSIGATFYGKFSVGLGISWGSNQSLGGYVEASIGLGGKGGASIGGFAGTNGYGISGGFGGFSASLSTNGIGFGVKTYGNNSSFGLNFNYNYASGLSGGFSFSKGNSSGSFSGLGMSFSSKGTSVSANVNGVGAGVSNYSESISIDDYSITTTRSGFTLPLFLFYVGYSKEEVTYSLLKRNSLNTSGMLYPVSSNVKKRNSHLLEENTFMDVNVFYPFGQTDSYSQLLEGDNNMRRNSLVLPNYDNYVVNAQGISGNIKPYIPFDLNLSGRGLSDKNRDNFQYLNYSYKDYKNNNVDGKGIEATTKKHFAFTNKHNSFLRIQKSNLPVGVLAPLNKVNSYNVLSTYKFQKDFNANYDNSNSLVGNKKREGNCIVTYTHNEIALGRAKGYIGHRGVDYDAKKEGRIRAFKITALDGKTYHYSIPVYNHLSVYRSFEKISDRDKKFVEIRKETPYATHWLLTAITGPDFVDTNNNNELDNEDYGYWVDFKYSWWSNDYAWRIPSDKNKYEEHIDVKDPNKKTFSYTWGMKEVYYLDAIKTRTHTAFFYKDTREDGKSIEFKEYKQRFTGDDKDGSFNINTYGKKYEVNNKYNYLYSGQYFKENGDGYSIPNRTTYKGRPINVDVVESKTQGMITYVDLPESKIMCLKKIVVVDNKYKNLFPERNIPHYPRIKGKIANNMYYSDLSMSIYQGTIGIGVGANVLYTSHPSKVHREPGFLVSQAFGLSVKGSKLNKLESKASQVIDFQYDYSLAQGAPNSSKGRLTLKKLHFKGKGGSQLVPPYEFSYGANYNYNRNYTDDWGYYKNNPAAWSLNKITTPVGGEIKVNYESDVYSTGAAYSKEVKFSGFTVNKNRITFSGVSNLKSYFTQNLHYKLKATRKVSVACHPRFGCRDIIRNVELRVKVKSVSSNWIEFYGGIPSTAYEIFGNSNGISTSNKGGGIRTKSIVVNDGIKDVATTEYIYKDGITSYAPSKKPQGVPYVSELPAPMVLYGEVEMQNKDGKGKYLGKTVYDFETLKPRQHEDGYIFSLGECFRVKENQSTTFDRGKVLANKYTIENRLGNIGRITDIRSYNSLGQLLSRTRNNYKESLDANGEIGVTQETHSSYKRVKKNNVEKFYVSSTSKIDYPSVLESVEQTSGGLTVTKHFDKYDFLTGQLLETRTYASHGKSFKSKIVPAYKKYGKMGSKIDNSNNKNMLSQVAAEYSYLYKNGTWQPVGVGMTTWKNNWTYKLNNNSTKSTNDVWRKHRTYTWNGDLNEDGTYSGFRDDFNWRVGANQNSKWKKFSEVTRYNQFSQSLEVIDVNNNYASTKMGDDYSKVIATSNANYDEMYYSGAEHIAKESSAYFDGGVKSVGRKLLRGQAHTGDYVVEVGSGGNAFEVTIPARSTRPSSSKFKVSVWVKKGQEANARIKVGGAIKSFNSSESVNAGNWVLLNGYVDVVSRSETKIAITSSRGTIQLDDFRLHPIASSMTSYGYNAWGEVSYIIGTNGLATHYKYDSQGRLKEVWSEVIDMVSGDGSGGFKLVKKHSYNYKRK